MHMMYANAELILILLVKMHMNAYDICKWKMHVTYGMPCGIISYRFKYRFGPQPLTFVSN